MLVYPNTRVFIVSKGEVEVLVILSAAYMQHKLKTHLKTLSRCAFEQIVESTLKFGLVKNHNHVTKNLDVPLPQPCCPHYVLGTRQQSTHVCLLHLAKQVCLV